MEWIGDHTWAAWLCLALGLGAAEMLTVDLTLLMLALGALAGGATALVAPDQFVVQVAVGVVVALASVFLLRPPLLARVRSARGYRGSVDQLVGSQAVAVAPIAPGGRGEIKVNGDTWTARSWAPGVAVRAGEQVEVVEIDGAIAVVRPLFDQLT
ncbi:hypothetical protein GCM10027418_08250 [Mariniluteicoccus endophyticus]